jgi:hypothetical protein
MNDALVAREKELSGETDSKAEEDSTLLSHLVRHTQDPDVLKDEVDTSHRFSVLADVDSRLKVGQSSGGWARYSQSN